MASTVRGNTSAGGDLAMATMPEGGPPNALTDRQIQLNWMWSFYACQPYAGRKTDWAGMPVLDHVEHEAISSAPFTPDGFVDHAKSSEELPLKYRKPTVPYHIVRAIVDKFTGMLFSAKRRPTVKCTDDPDTEDWLAGVVLDSKLWSCMTLARAYGGSTGSAAVGFRFVKGRPVIEVHDPRWCEPEFEDRDTGELKRFEKRYTYQADLRDSATGQLVRAWFWYRRVTDKWSDIVWPRVKVEEAGYEPDWINAEKIERKHNYGFCPVVWIQNHRLADSVDGWSDVEGVHEYQMGMDALQAQAHKGTLANCDPTPIMSSDAEDEYGGGVKKGTGNGIQVEKGGSVAYLEMTGSGVEAAMKLIDSYRKQALEIAKCVLDSNFDGPAKTEEEVESNYSSMIECADLLRDQYGDAVKMLLEMILSAARMLGGKRPAMRGGKVVVLREVVRLTPRVVEDPETGRKTRTPRKIGAGTIIEVQWPEYKQHSLDDMGKSVTATSLALQSHLIDSETGTRAVAPYFHVTDVQKVIDKAKEETEQENTAYAEELAERAGQMGRIGGNAG